MASPVPLLRAPVPGGRNQSGTRTPRLGLAIPPSPSHRPVAGTNNPPQLSLATPMGSQGAPQEGGGRLKLNLNISMANNSNDHNRARSDSFHNPSVPGSASSSTYSTISNVLNGGRHNGTPDPASAISSVWSEVDGSTSMERENSMTSLSFDFDKLELEKGAPVDVEDLDDDSWGAASDQKRIIELGSLGEGAGGAVTKSILRGGKTVFALKVRIQTVSHEMIS